MVGIVIHWFRQDLRLTDNPALCYAANTGKVLPIYILDDINARDHAIGSASRWWLHHSLASLDKDVSNGLQYFCGDAKQILADLVKKHDVQCVTWNRCYEPWRISRDKAIKALLSSLGVDVHTDNASLLWEPWVPLKADGSHYRVFTPFYRKGCLTAEEPRLPQPKPKNLTLADKKISKVSLDELSLLPTIPWDAAMTKTWKIGERAALKQLKRFLKTGISHYYEGRNFPAKQNVSRLSPHLHFGEISPNQAWYAAKQTGDNREVDHFLSELGWREFSYSLLYHCPTLPKKNLQTKFNQFPWKKNTKHLQAWQKGMTGYPIVDAGMRELWQTGYMHNRVRMIVASFLVKNLLIDWREGEAWFWDCLVDADLANNSASWQWVAGCGADASPFFRIFNPVTQGEKFDPEGEYTKKYIPELANVPAKYLQHPWDAPSEILVKANITLGKTYPKPIIDLKVTRERALAAFKTL